MKQKLRMKLEIKEISAEGTFEGLLSPYNNVDDGGDLVEPGAYTKTLKDSRDGNTRPLLWQHDPKQPIGNLTLEDRPEGLWCKGQLLMALPEAQKAYLLMKAKIVRGLSIGFLTVKDAVENGVRRLKEIKLYEGSVVTFPMNESALIASVKSKDRETKGDFNEELSEIQLSDAGYQMGNALSSALSSLFWSGLKKEEIVTAAETIIQQFSDAYMAYVPLYIDMLTEYYGDMVTWSAKRFETKEGRKVSAATKETLKLAHSHMDEGAKCMKAAMDMIFPLFEDEAEAEDEGADSKSLRSTSQKTAGVTTPEPVNHSAKMTLIDKTIKEIVWNPLNRN